MTTLDEVSSAATGDGTGFATTGGGSGCCLHARVQATHAAHPNHTVVLDAWRPVTRPPRYHATRTSNVLVGIAGSLRKGSFNAALLRAAAELAPAGTRVAIETIAGIPLYDGDLEQAHGVPERAQALKDRIAGAQGLPAAPRSRALATRSPASRCLRWEALSDWWG